MEIETLDDIVGCCFYRRCSVLLNDSVYLLSRLFTKLAATILKVCKLVSSSLSVRLRKSKQIFSSIHCNDLDIDSNTARLAAKYFTDLKPWFDYRNDYCSSDLNQPLRWGLCSDTDKRFFSRLTKDLQKPEFLHKLFLENEEESGEIKYMYTFLSHP